LSRDLGIAPPNPRRASAGPATVAAFLAHEADRGSRAATITRGCAAIRYAIGSPTCRPRPTDREPPTNSEHLGAALLGAARPIARQFCDKLVQRSAPGRQRDAGSAAVAQISAHSSALKQMSAHWSTSVALGMNGAIRCNVNAIGPIFLARALARLRALVKTAVGTRVIRVGQPVRVQAANFWWSIGDPARRAILRQQPGEIEAAEARSSSCRNSRMIGGAETMQKLGTPGHTSLPHPLC
jgi:hypothetical protein